MKNRGFNQKRKFLRQISRIDTKFWGYMHHKDIASLTQKAYFLDEAFP